MAAPSSAYKYTPPPGICQAPGRGLLLSQGSLRHGSAVTPPSKREAFFHPCPKAPSLRELSAARLTEGVSNCAVAPSVTASGGATSL